MTSYKCCAVPMCRSTTIKYANKLFIHVPKCPKRRKQWLRLARRDQTLTSDKSTIFFCEDHFDLPTDMENYMQYNIMGTINQIRMNPDSLPSKFDCQIANRPRNIPLPHDVDRPKTKSKKKPWRQSGGSAAKFKKGKTPSKTKVVAEHGDWVEETEQCDLVVVRDGSNDTDTAEETETGVASAGQEENCPSKAEWLGRPDVCRCCLASGASWDITGSYMSDDGEMEVFLDMLSESLGIRLSYLAEFGPSRFVCDTCVISLRHAHNFKQQVVRADERFAAYLREKKGEQVEIKTENMEPLALVDIFETDEMCNDVDIKIENETDSTPETSNTENFQTTDLICAENLRDNLETKGSHNTEYSSMDNLNTIQEFGHRTGNQSKDKSKAAGHTCNTDHSYSKLVEDIESISQRHTENNSECETLTCSKLTSQPTSVMKHLQLRKEIKKMNPIDKSLGKSRLIYNKMKMTTGDIKMGKLMNKQPIKVSSGRESLDVSSINSAEVGFEKVGNNCFNNKPPIDYDSDTPLSQFSQNGDDGTELTAFKRGRCRIDEQNLSPKVLCKVPQYAPVLAKQVSERRRIRLTCDTVLKDTTACPFRHHKSWFQCFYCPLDFMAINTLRDHTTLHHTSEELTQIKRYPRSLQIDITELKCKICSLDLTDVQNMVQHFFDVHQKVVYKECIADYKVNASPFSCHLCCKQYHVFRTLTTHLNEHYANCICDVCGKSFLNTKRLKVHKRTHESGNFPCTECGKVLKTKTSKANHMETHSKRILKCHICLQPMKHYNDRVKHMSEVHDITYKFQCPVCGREYNIRHYLATHMRQTHGHRNKTCPECNMAFITNHGLKKHMLKHTGVKSFPCTICNKSYARSYTLKEHLRCHEGEAVGQ